MKIGFLLAAAVLAALFVLIWIFPRVVRGATAGVLTAVYRRFLKALQRDFARESLELKPTGGAFALVGGGLRPVVLDMRGPFMLSAKRETPKISYVDEATAVARRQHPPALSDIGGSLLPILANAFDAERLKSGLGFEAPHRTFAEELFIFYRYEVSGLAYLVGHTELGEWDLDEDGLHERALANLTARTRDAEVRLLAPLQAFPTLIRLHSGDGLDATRALLARGLLPAGGAGYVVTIPDRDTLLCCPMDEPLARLRMEAMTRRHRQLSPFRLSGALFKVEGDGSFEALGP